MKTSETITEELRALESRRAELATDVEAACQDLAARREGLVSGSVSVEQVTAAQAKYTALAEALGTLDTRIAASREALAAAEQEEAEQQRRDRIVAIGQERAAAVAGFQRARAAANEALHGPVEEMLAALDRWHALGKEGRALLNATSSPGLMRHDAASLDFPQVTLEPYGQAVDMALQIAHNARDRARRKAAA